MTRWVGALDAHPPARIPAPGTTNRGKATITTSRIPKTASARALSRAGAAALLAVSGLAGLGAAPAGAADDPPTWSVTTGVNDYGSQRENFEYTVNAGDTIDDGIVVANDGTDAVDLAVYGADAFTTDSGALDVRTERDDATGVGAWLEPAVRHVSLAPGQSAEVPFTIAVPADADPGDHVGGIVTSRAVTSDGRQVEQRVALRVHVHVAGLFRPGLQVEDLRAQYGGPSVGTGDATVTYTLHNTGNAVLSARQDVAVAGPFGALAVHAGSLPDSPALLPGESWKVSVPVEGVVRTGRLGVTVTLTPLFTDPAGSTSELAPVTAGTRQWAMSWLVVLVGLVGLGLVGLAVRLVVRLARRPRGRPTTDRGHPDPDAGPDPQPETSLSANRAHAASPNTTA